jgi:1-acyl-sn-glycerol-3-phosphate acyltransferase
MSQALITVFSHVRSVIGILFVIPYTVFCSCFAIFSGALGMHNRATDLIRVWSIAILGVFGIKVAVRGEENLPAEGGGIVVFNHQSLFDIPVLVSSTGKRIRFGAKIELFKIPFFGAAMRAVGTLPIARENRAGVMKIYKEAEARFKENFIFVLAPEGTRQKQPAIGRFKKGPFMFATSGGVPIIPVVIKGANAVLPKQSLGVNLGRLSRTIYIEYLPPVDAKAFASQKIDELVETVRSAMVAKYAALPSDP